MKLLVVAGGSNVVKVAIGEMELHDASERTVIIDSSRYHHLCSRICMCGRRTDGGCVGPSFDPSATYVLMIPRLHKIPFESF